MLSHQLGEKHCGEEQLGMEMDELGADCHGVGGKWNGRRGSGSRAAGQPSLEQHQSSCCTHMSSSVAGVNVLFVLSAVDLEGLKFRVHSWPFAVDFCLNVGLALSRPGMSPGPSLWDTRCLGLSLDFSVPGPMESSALGCSGVL